MPNKHILTYNISICYFLKSVNNKTMDKNFEDLINNLKDANCKNDFIQQIIKEEIKGDIKKEIKLLEFHRKNLLNSLHKFQKHIDCLDYLIFKIKTKIKEKQ